MSRHDTSAHSLTDLMTSLAVIFILLLVATVSNEQSEKQDKQNAIQDIREEVVSELEKLDLELKTDPDDPYTQVIVLEEDKLKFSTNSSKIPRSSHQLLSSLFKLVVPVVCNKKIRGKIEYIKVEGHADSQYDETVKQKIHNVDLSQNRALAVVKQAFNVLDGNRPQFKCFKDMVIAVGRGTSRLKKTDSESRRVEISIKVKNQDSSPVVDKVKEAKENARKAASN